MSKVFIIQHVNTDCIHEEEKYPLINNILQQVRIGNYDEITATEGDPMSRIWPEIEAIATRKEKWSQCDHGPRNLLNLFLEFLEFPQEFPKTQKKYFELQKSFREIADNFQDQTFIPGINNKEKLVETGFFPWLRDYDEELLEALTNGSIAEMQNVFVRGTKHWIYLFPWIKQLAGSEIHVCGGFRSLCLQSLTEAFKALNTEVTIIEDCVFAHEDGKMVFPPPRIMNTNIKQNSDLNPRFDGPQI